MKYSRYEIAKRMSHLHKSEAEVEQAWLDQLDDGDPDFRSFVSDNYSCYHGSESCVYVSYEDIPLTDIDD